MLVEDLKWVTYAWEISPTLVFVPILFIKENKTNKGSTSLSTREPKFYSYDYYFMTIIFIYIMHFKIIL
jgi:hypothetical protein